MSNANSNADALLNNIVGFAEGAARKEKREQSGTDFSDQKGKTQSDIAKLHPKRLKLTVERVIDETASTKTFRLVGDAGDGTGILPPFQAGQYINWYVNIGGVETARPYAISSCPSQRGYYDITVKLVDGGFVTNFLLNQVKAGDEFTSTSPMGTFYHNPIFHGNDLVFLAGGSGGAPARSMIESVLNRGLDINYHLVYGNSYENDVIFKEEFEDLAKRYDNFTLTQVISRPTENYTGLSGHLNKDLLTELLTKDGQGSIEDKTFYVCGPTPFNEFCEQQLKELGVENKRIRIECNGPPKKPCSLPMWPEGLEEEKEVLVTVKDKGQFKAKVGEPLLNSLERNGYTVENACRSGECSLCRVKVLDGEVFNPPEAHLRKSDKEFGWVHSCVAFPTKDIEILY